MLIAFLQFCKFSIYRCTAQIKSRLFSMTTFSSSMRRLWFASADCVVPHKSARHAMAVPPMVRPVSDGRRARWLRGLSTRVPWKWVTHHLKPETETLPPLLPRVRWWPEAEAGSHPCEAPPPLQTTLTCCEIGSIVQEQPVVKAPPRHMGLLNKGLQY